MAARASPHPGPGRIADLGEEVNRRSGRMYREPFEAVPTGRLTSPPRLPSGQAPDFATTAAALATGRCLGAADANRLVIISISELPGALLCRAVRSTEPVEIAGASAVAAVRAAV